MMNMMMKVFSFFSILILFPIPFHFRYGIFSVLLDNELSYKARYALCKAKCLLLGEFPLRPLISLNILAFPHKTDWGMNLSETFSTPFI